MKHMWIVTGANRGLGLEFVRQLGAAGRNVVATVRRPDEAGELAELGARVERLDVTDDDSVAGLARRLEGVSIEVLINNAGYGVGNRRFQDVDPDALKHFFDVNSIGPLRVSRALRPHLETGERRTIVNVTSRMGSIDDNASGGAYGYRASKAALNMITASMAVDLGHDGFICIVLHPGWVRTRMGGDNAPLTPEESVRGMLRVIDGLGPEDNGRFLDHSGKEIPW